MTSFFKRKQVIMRNGLRLNYLIMYLDYAFIYYFNKTISIHSKI